MSILVLGILALIGYSLFSKGYFRFQPEGKLYESNSNIVYKFLAEKQSELVAFEQEEFSLISGNKMKLKSTSFFDKPIEGILLSIYNEPFVAFKVIYHSEKLKTGVIGMATRNNTYLYVMKKDHVDVFFDKKPLGTIQMGGKLFFPSTKTEIASYSLKNATEYLIRVGGVPSAEVKHEIAENSLPQRVVDTFDMQEASGDFAMRIMVFYLIGLGIKL
jgi:hypothetical protein